MADRPIIFSAPMVRALLEGRKTQTRRKLKPQPDDTLKDAALPKLLYAPFDRLWVREQFMPAPMEAVPNDARATLWNFAYGAGGQAEVIAPPEYNPMLYNYERWSPSIHMPRWASRLTLTVTDVRVQRLQDISQGDARSEGWGGYLNSATPDAAGNGPRTWFKKLWNSLHGPDAWDANPWVVALTFTVELGNIDQLYPIFTAAKPGDADYEAPF